MPNSGASNSSSRRVPSTQSQSGDALGTTNIQDEPQDSDCLATASRLAQPTSFRSCTSGGSEIDDGGDNGPREPLKSSYDSSDDSSDNSEKRKRRQKIKRGKRPQLGNDFLESSSSDENTNKALESPSLRVPKSFPSTGGNQFLRVPSPLVVNDAKGDFDFNRFPRLAGRVRAKSDGDGFKPLKNALHYQRHRSIAGRDVARSRLWAETTIFDASNGQIQHTRDNTANAQLNANTADIAANSSSSVAGGDDMSHAKHTSWCRGDDTFPLPIISFTEQSPPETDQAPLHGAPEKRCPHGRKISDEQPPGTAKSVASDDSEQRPGWRKTKLVPAKVITGEELRQSPWMAALRPHEMQNRGMNVEIGYDSATAPPRGGDNTHRSTSSSDDQHEGQSIGGFDTDSSSSKEVSERDVSSLREVSEIGGSASEQVEIVVMAHSSIYTNITRNMQSETGEAQDAEDAQAGGTRFSQTRLGPVAEQSENLANSGNDQTLDPMGVDKVKDMPSSGCSVENRIFQAAAGLQDNTVVDAGYHSALSMVPSLSTPTITGQDEGPPVGLDISTPLQILEVESRSTVSGYVPIRRNSTISMDSGTNYGCCILEALKCVLCSLFQRRNDQSQAIARCRPLKQREDQSHAINNGDNPSHFLVGCGGGFRKWLGRQSASFGGRTTSATPQRGTDVASSETLGHEMQEVMTAGHEARSQPTGTQKPAG